MKDAKTNIKTSFSLYNYRSGFNPSLPYEKGGHQEHKKERKKKKRKKGMALTVTHFLWLVNKNEPDASSPSPIGIWTKPLSLHHNFSVCIYIYIIIN